MLKFKSPDAWKIFLHSNLCNYRFFKSHYL